MNKIEDALIVTVGRLQQDSAGAVAEEHASCAILIIQYRSHDVTADYERLVLRSRADELRAYRQSVNETGTRRRKIESPCVRSAQLVLHEARSGGKHHVGSYAGDHDQINVFRRHAFGFEQNPGR